MIASIGAWDPALLPGIPRPAATSVMDALISLVAEHFRVPASKLKSPLRTQRVAFVRQVAMYLGREIFKLQWHEIGDAFDRDHSTCCHGRDVIAERMEASPQFAAQIGALKVMCKCNS